MTARRQRAEALSEWQDLVRHGERLDTTSAPVELVVFVDYQCPFCRFSEQELQKLLASEPNVGVVFRQYPVVSLHNEALRAAKAALCAADQGLFAAMSKQLYATTKWKIGADLWPVAAAAGVKDREAFAQCQHDPGTLRRIEADMRFAGALEVSGTPTYVFSDGRVHVGAMRFEQLEERIRALPGRAARSAP